MTPLVQPTGAKERRLDLPSDGPWLAWITPCACICLMGGVSECLRAPNFISDARGTIWFENRGDAVGRRRGPLGGPRYPERPLHGGADVQGSLADRAQRRLGCASGFGARGVRVGSRLLSSVFAHFEIRAAAAPPAARGPWSLRSPESGDIRGCRVLCFVLDMRWGGRNQTRVVRSLSSLRRDAYNGCFGLASSSNHGAAARRSARRCRVVSAQAAGSCLDLEERDRFDGTGSAAESDEGSHMVGASHLVGRHKQQLLWPSLMASVDASTRADALVGTWIDRPIDQPTD